MTEQELRINLEELGVEKNKIDEMVPKLLGGHNLAVDNSAGLGKKQEQDLKVRIMEERDWRKRSQLAALIISNNLGE